MGVGEVVGVENLKVYVWDFFFFVRELLSTRQLWFYIKDRLPDTQPIFQGDICVEEVRSVAGN